MCLCSLVYQKIYFGYLNSLVPDSQNSQPVPVYLHLYVCCVFGRVRVHSCAHVFCTYACMHVFMYNCKHACVYICMRVFVYIRGPFRGPLLQLHSSPYCCMYVTKQMKFLMHTYVLCYVCIQNFLVGLFFPNLKGWVVPTHAFVQCTRDGMFLDGSDCK